MFLALLQPLRATQLPSDLRESLIALRMALSQQMRRSADAMADMHTTLQDVVYTSAAKFPFEPQLARLASHSRARRVLDSYHVIITCLCRKLLTLYVSYRATVLHALSSCSGQIQRAREGEESQRGGPAARVVAMGLPPLEYIECYLDSPSFREIIALYEKELEENAVHVKSLVKECRHMIQATEGEQTGSWLPVCN